MKAFIPKQIQSAHSSDYRSWAAQKGLQFFQRVTLVPWLRTRFVYALDDTQADELLATNGVLSEESKGAVPHSFQWSGIDSAKAGSPFERELRKTQPLGYATAVVRQTTVRMGCSARLKNTQPRQRDYRKEAAKQGRRFFREDYLTCCYVIERSYSTTESAALTLMNFDSRVVEVEGGTVALPPARLVRSAAAGSDGEVRLRRGGFVNVEARQAGAPFILRAVGACSFSLCPLPATDWRASVPRIRGAGEGRNMAGIRVHDDMGRM